MAQTYQCDICGEVAGDFMVTYVNDGKTVCVGVECLLDWAMPIAQAYAEMIETHQTAAETPQAAAEPPADDWEDGYPERGRAPEEGPPDATEDDDREGSTAGAAADVPG